MHIELNKSFDVERMRLENNITHMSPGLDCLNPQVVPGGTKAPAPYGVVVTK